MRRRRMPAIITAMEDPIVRLDRPSFRNPALLAGFGGWANAGEVSTWVVSYLLKSFGGTKFAEILPEPFYDLSQQRPVVRAEKGRIKSVDFPSNAFYATEMPDPARRDLILFLGQEPHLHWPCFTKAFVDFAEDLGVVQIFTIGGLYDNIPHTMEPPVSGLVNQEGGLEHFARLKILPGEYEGPMSIHTQLLTVAGHKPMSAMSLWGHVPYYIQSSNAKTCLAVLERLRGLMDLPLELKDVRRASEMLDDQIDRIIQSKPDLKQYIQSLERDYAAGETRPRWPSAPMQPSGSGEKIIRIDPFLRRDENPPPQS